MSHLPKSLAAVGAEFENDRGAARKAEIKVCRRGEPVTLRGAPRLNAAHYPIEVFSARGIAIGYVGAEQGRWIGARLDAITALFQRTDTFGAVVRVSFDGKPPALSQRGKPAKRQSDWPPRTEPDDFAEA